MIAVVSPAKTLDFDSPSPINQKTNARLFDRSKGLLETLKAKDVNDISQMMSLSESLSSLNVKRFQNFKSRHTDKNSKQAIYAFRGDVYLGLDAETLTEEDIMYAGKHFRMLSGLYGLLRPLDMIQPYRLEMGTQLKVNGYSNLYQYWGDTITKALNNDLSRQGDRTLLNLASVEYFKSVNRKALKGNIIDVDFKDFKNGEYKIISFFAKKARGLMSRYVIKNQISSVEDLKGFDYEGYYFDSKNSTDTKLSFKRG
ncbi:MAG: peroxide stress protein YaaA [Cyclobacteriaceae bacterium]